MPYHLFAIMKVLYLKDIAKIIQELIHQLNVGLVKWVDEPITTTLTSYCMATGYKVMLIDKHQWIGFVIPDYKYGFNL